MLCALPRALWWWQHNVSVHFSKGICITHTVICSGHGWTTGTVSITLLGPCPPPSNGNQCPLLWEPSYGQTKSHCVLQLLAVLPVGLLSLHWLHWYNMLMVPSMDVRKTIYTCLFHSEMHCQCYFMWDVLLPHSLKFPHINVGDTTFKIS